MQPIVRYEESLSLNREGPFPAKLLLSRKDKSAASVKIGTLEKGKNIELHNHQLNDQIEYCLGGRAIMFIEGLGEKEIRKGALNYIPKGVNHSITKVFESIRLLTIFIPCLF
jgi:quercetin dioxygenase-like cupin family protein